MDLVITREFNAPAKALWGAWSIEEKTKQWWGPKMFTCPVAKIDFRVGGKYLLAMRSPEGKDYYSTGTYKEIVPLKKIVCTDSFANKDGKVIPASEYGMPGKFPLEMLVTITLEEKKGKTKMTIVHSGHPKEIGADATQGWNEQLDKLEQLLKK